MDEMDLYDDLDEFQEQQEKKSKELQDVEEKYSKALVTIQGLEEEKTCLQKKIERMELSFQSLLDTARTEINRKDKEIERLRKEKDDICFRRKFSYNQGRNTVSGEATKSILPELAKESYNLKRIEQHSNKFQKSDCEGRTRNRTSEQEDAYKSKKSWILKSKGNEENSNKHHKSDCESRIRDRSSEREDPYKSKESSNLRRIETEQHLNKLQKSECESRIRDRSSERKGSYKSKESYNLKRKETAENSNKQQKSDCESRLRDRSSEREGSYKSKEFCKIKKKETEENSNKYHKSNYESRVRDRSSERKGSYKSRESCNLKRKETEENSNNHHKSDCESRIRDRSSERKGSYKVKESRKLTRKETEENSNKHQQKSDCVSRIRDRSYERFEESYKRQRTHDERETYDSKRFRDDGSRQKSTDSQRHRNRCFYKTDPVDRLAKTDCHIRNNSQKRTDHKSYTSSSKSPCRDKQTSSRLSRYHHRKHSPHRRDECDLTPPSRSATNCNSNNDKTSKPLESFFKDKSASHCNEEQLPANFCEYVRPSQQEFNNDLKCQKSLDINEPRQNPFASKFLPLECNDSLENDSLKQQRTSENILDDNATDEMHLYESLNAEAEFSLGPDEFEDLLYADLDCESNQDILDCESNQDILIVPEKCFSSEKSSAKSYEPANEVKKDSFPAVDNESTLLNEVTQEDSSSVCELYSPTDIVTTSDRENDSPKMALIDLPLFVPSPSTDSCCETNKIQFPTIMDLELQKQNNETTTATATELNNDCVSFVNENVNENHRKFDLNTFKTSSLSNINKTNSLSPIKDLISLAHIPLVEEDFKNFKTDNNYNMKNCQATIIHITPAISDKSSTSTSPGDSSSDCLVVVTPTRDKADDIPAQDCEQSEIDNCFIKITNACEKVGAEFNLSIPSPGDVVEKTSSVHALRSLTAPNDAHNDAPIDLIEILSEKNLECSKNNKNAKENPEMDSVIEYQINVNNDEIGSETNDQVDKKGSASVIPSEITSIKSLSEITWENDTDGCLTFSGKGTKCLPSATSAESKSSSNYVNQCNIKNEEQANIKHLDKSHEPSKCSAEIEKNQLVEENKLKHKIHIESDLIITKERILESDKSLVASNAASSSKIDLDCCMDQFSSTNMQKQNSVTPEIEKFVKNVCDQEPQQPSKVYLEKQQNQSVFVIASLEGELQLPLKSLENCGSLIETADLPSTEREKINIHTFASENILANKTKCSEKNTEIWNSNCSIEKESIAASPNPQKTSSEITSSQTKENISEKTQIASKSYKTDLNTFISSKTTEADKVEAQLIDDESKQTNEIESIGDDKNPAIATVTETVAVPKTLSETPPQPIESVLISDDPETSKPIESILTSDDENVVGDKQNSRKNCLSFEEQQQNDLERIEKTPTNENVSLASAELLHMEERNCDVTLTSLTYDDINDACLPDNCSINVFSMQIINSTNQEGSNFAEKSMNQLTTKEIETEKQKESSILNISKIDNINFIKDQNSKHSEDEQLSVFASQTCESQNLKKDSAIESSYMEKTSLSHFDHLPSKTIEIEKEKDMSVANVPKIDIIDSIPQNQRSKYSEDVELSSTSQTCESHNLKTDSSIDTKKQEDLPLANASKIDIIDSIPQKQDSKHFEDEQLSSSTSQTCDSHSLKKDSSIDTEKQEDLYMANVSIDSIQQNQNSKQSEDVQSSSSTFQTCDSHNLKKDSSIDTETRKGMSMANVSKIDIIDSIPQNLNSKQSEDEQLYSSTSQTCESHNPKKDSSIDTTANASKIDIIDSIPQKQDSKHFEDEQLSSSTSQTCDSHSLKKDSSIDTEKQEDLSMANVSKIDIIDSIPQNHNSKHSEDEQLSISTSPTCDSHSLKKDSSIDTEKQEDLYMANVSIDSIQQNQNSKQSEDVQSSSSTFQTCDSHNLKKDSSIDTETRKGMSMANVSKIDIIDSIPQNLNSKQSEDEQLYSSTSQTCESHNPKKDSSIDTTANVSKIYNIDSIPQNQNSKHFEDVQLSISTSQTRESPNPKKDSSIDTEKQNDMPMANVSKIDIIDSIPQNQNSKHSEDVQLSSSTSQTCDSHNLKKDSSIDTEAHKGISMANVSKIDNIDSIPQNQNSKQSEDGQLSSSTSQTCDSHSLNNDPSIVTKKQEVLPMANVSKIDIIDSIPQNQNSKHSEDEQLYFSTSETCVSHILKKDSSIDTNKQQDLPMVNVSKIDIIDSIPQNLNCKQSEDEQLYSSTSQTCESHNPKKDSSIDTEKQNDIPMANVSKHVQLSLSTSKTCDSHILKKDSSIDTEKNMANVSKIDNKNSLQEDNDSMNSKDEQLSLSPSQNIDSHNLKRNSSIENSHKETISLDQCSLIAEIKTTLLKSCNEKCKIIDYSEMPATLSVRANEGKTKGLSPYKNTCHITEHKSKCHNEKCHSNPLTSTVVEDLQENPKTLGLDKGKNSPQNKEIKKCKEEKQILNVKEILDDIQSNIPKQCNNGNNKTNPGLDILSLENVNLPTAAKLICVAEEQHVESLPNLKSIATCEKLIENMESVKESMENSKDEACNVLPKTLGLTENHKEGQEENIGKFERIRDVASTKFETQLQRKSISLDKDNAGLVQTDTLISGESNNFNFNFTENQSTLENPECLSAATQSTEFSNFRIFFPKKIAQKTGNTLIPGLDLLELSPNKSSVNSILNKNSIEYLDDKGAATSLKGAQESQKEMIAEVSTKAESLINDKEAQRNNVMNIGSLALKEQGALVGNVLASESTNEKVCCQKKPQMKEEIENIKNLMNLTNTNSSYINSIFLSSQPKSNDHKEFNEINNNPETEKTKNTNALQTKAQEYLKGSGFVNIVRQEEFANNNTVLQINTPKANVSAQNRDTSYFNSCLEEIRPKEVDLCTPMLIDSLNVYSEVMSKITINYKENNEQTSSGFDSIINYEQNLCLAEKSSGKSVLGKSAANLEKIFDKPQDYSLVDSTNKLLSSFNAAMLKTPRTNIINSAKLKPSTSNNCGFSNNLPSVSTKCPTPPNFSGIFSKTTLNDSDFEEHVLNTKKSPAEGKSLIIPATSVLCNVNNLENDTKSSKKLHWEMLENKSETLEMEDDSEVNNSSDEEKKRWGYVKNKEECVGSVKNLSTQKKKHERQTLKETMIICKERRKFSEKDTDCRKQKISMGLKSKKASLPKRRNTLDTLPPPLGDETVEQFRQLAIRQQSPYASSFTPQNIVKKLSKISGQTNKLKENLISSLSSNTEESVNRSNKSLSALNPEQLPNLNNDLPIVKKKRGRPPKQKPASTDEKCEKMKTGSQSGGGGGGGGARVNRDNMPKDDVAAINRFQEAERGRSSDTFAKTCTKSITKLSKQEDSLLKKPHTITNAGSSVHKSHMETNDLSTCHGHKTGEKCSCISKNSEPICKKFIDGAELQLMPEEAENKQMEHKAKIASTKLIFKTANKNALINFKIPIHKTEVEGAASRCNMPLLPAQERQVLNKKTVKDNFSTTKNYGKHFKEKQNTKKSKEKQQPYRPNSKNKKESLNVSDQGTNKAKNSTVHKKSLHIPERNEKSENFVSGLKIPRSQLSPKEAIGFEEDDVKNEEKVKQNITSKRRKSLNLPRRIYDTTSEEEEEEEEVDDVKTVILKPAKVNQKNKNKSERDNKKTQEKTLKEELSKDTNVENKTVNNEDSPNSNVNNIEKKKLYDQYMQARNECLRLEKLLTLSDDSNVDLEKNGKNNNIIYKSNTFQIHKDGESFKKALGNEKLTKKEENQANRKVVRGESEIYKKDIFPSIIRARRKSMYNETNLFKSADILSSDISNNNQLDSERSTHDLGRYQDGNLRKSIRNRRKSLPAEKGSMLISSDETETANEAATSICELRRKESKECYADSKERGNYKDTQGETLNKNKKDLNLWGLHDNSIKPIKNKQDNKHKKTKTSENKSPKNVYGKKVGMEKEEIELITSHDQTTDLNVCNISDEHIGISNLKRRKLDTPCNEYDEKLVNPKKTVIEKCQNEEYNCFEIKASSTSVRKRRIVKVLSMSIKGEERQREAKELSSISDEFETLPSKSPCHSIFKTNELPSIADEFENLPSKSPSCHSIFNRSDLEKTETSPNLMSVSQDDRYKNLDSELRDMFQSPQHETERLAHVPPTIDDSLKTLYTNETHINDTSHNVTIDETTFSTNRENSGSFLSDSKSLNSSTSQDQNCTAKHISLGTSDYRFEKVSDNVVNLFITRKRKRRNK